MAARPYWSGQIRLSLVSFKIALFGALKRGSQIPLHEIDRNSGERVHHQLVLEDGSVVQREDIVKGFEAEKNEYVLLEPEEIDNIKLPSSDTLALENFVELSGIPIARFERPYFVTPQGKDAEEIYPVLQQALLSDKKAGIGQITLRGREELCALYAVENGLMLSTLRYNAEMEDGKEFLPGEPKKKLKSDYVSLMGQLIDKNSHAAHFEKFHDHYHEALKELISAKKAHRKPKLPKAEKQPAKVVNFMDALKKSLGAKGGKTKVARHTRRKSA
ncbi:MAG TPA: Ku protein [Alphaproteobacteria bacterium]|nr:Ku protein [Alphaproteobacteria bacterium]